MSEALLLQLAPDIGVAGEAMRQLTGAQDVQVLSLSDVPARLPRALRAPRPHLGFVLGPEASEIGSGLLPLVAVATGARRVTGIHVRWGALDSQTLPGFLASTLPHAALQLGVSGLALALQRGLAATLPRPAAARPAPGCADLRRVLYLRPHAGSPAGVGGSVTHTHGVIRALRKEGVAVAAFTTDASIAHTARLDPEPPCRWHTVGVPRALKALPASTVLGVDLALAAASARIARAADAIYQRHSRFSLSGALLARLTGRPLLLEYNGPESYLGSQWQPSGLAGQLLACEDASLACASRIFVVTEQSRRELVERGVPSERIVVNPNGVDARRFDRGGGEAVRGRLGLAPSDFVTGFLGSFGPWHGAKVLARAFVRVAGELPCARLLLVGDGMERRQAVELVERAGYGDRVLVLGKISPGDVPVHLDACDVLASPHVELPDGMEFFGSPTKLFEYMAARKPIVASRLGQIGDVLEHGETALLVPPGDERALAAGILRVAASPELGERLGRGARAAAIERHGWDLNAVRIGEAYRSLASSGER